MASAIDHQHTTNGGSYGMNGSPASSGMRKSPAAATAAAVNRPPSPPSTDTETDTEAPTNTAAQPRSALIPAPTIGSLVAGLDTNPEPQLAEVASAGTEASDIAVPSTPDKLSPVTSPVMSPPYWNYDSSNNRNNNAASGGWSRHDRSVSSASVESFPRGGITLRDNENSSIDERGNACWARSVRVTDWTVVNGSTTGIGAFVVFNIRVETLNVSRLCFSPNTTTSDTFVPPPHVVFPILELVVDRVNHKYRGAT